MGDDDELYDEFGNYIGPALDSSDEEEEESETEEARPVDKDDEESDVSSMGDAAAETALVEADADKVTARQEDAIVLHEDKVHYPSAEEVFGSNVRTVVLDEDAMELEQPLVEPVKTKVVTLVQDDTMGKSTRGTGDTADTQPMLVSDEFLTQHLLSNETTNTRRGVVLAGHLHCGKTTFLDMLLEQQMVCNHPDALGPKAALPPQTAQVGSTNPHLNTNATNRNDKGQHGGPRFTDTLLLEQARQLSMKMTPVTLAMPNTNGGRHFALTIMDCPGHPQFHDETVASMRLADGVCLMVDAVEGAETLHVDMVVALAVSEGLPLTLCINKIDRLIVELKLPPNDAYFKLLHIIESVNVKLQSKLTRKAQDSQLYPPLSPDRNNVCFASSQHGWCTSLHQMAQLYADCNAWDVMSPGQLGENLTVDEFAKRLWGDCYLDPIKRTFHSSIRDCTPDPNGHTLKRTFIQFFLEPLYKLYAICIGEEGKDVDRLLRSVGVHLSKEQLRSSARPLLRAACKRFFGPSSTGFVDMIVQHIPCPKRAAKGKVTRGYTGPISSLVAQDMIKCSARRIDNASSSPPPLMMHITKLIPSSDGQSFSAFGRIYSGTITPLQKVKVLGEDYSPEDDEDMASATVTSIFILQGRRKIELSRATAGNWVFLDGVDATIAKTATITSYTEDSTGDDEEALRIFRPLSFAHAGHESVMKVAVEPLNPAELPKMVEGLRRLSKSYPMSKTKVEETGEHVLLGTGELYLDAMMHDLCHVYSDIEVRVADPVVVFRETVVDTSQLQCFAETPNKRNKLTLSAEPWMAKCEVSLINWDTKKIGRFFQSTYD